MNSATVASGDQALATQYNNLRKDIIKAGGDYATSGGAANVQTLTIDAQYNAYVTGDIIKFKAGFTNTAATTLNINTIGAIAVQKDGMALTGGEIIVGRLIKVFYDGTNFQLISDNEIPVGTLMIWVTDTAPAGYLLCYGQAVSRTTYAALFAVTGTTFGVGDGVTTFNLPDLRGRFPLGQDDMGGASANRVTNAQADTIGGVAGAETHQLTIAEMPSHDHALHDNPSGGGGVAVYVTESAIQTVTADSDMIDNTGGDGAHNNMSPYITMNYIIKT